MCINVYACVCVRGLVNERLTLRALPRARGGLLLWLWPSHPTIKWTRHYVWAKGCVFVVLSLSLSLRSISRSLSQCLSLCFFVFLHAVICRLPPSLPFCRPPWLCRRPLPLFPTGFTVLLFSVLLPLSLRLVCLGVVWRTLPNHKHCWALYTLPLLVLIYMSFLVSTETRWFNTKW